MKVKCIDAREFLHVLEAGAVYDVTYEDERFYGLRHANGLWEKWRFEVLPESNLQETPVMYVEREKPEITYKDFLASMPTSARACVMIGTEGQTVSVYDMEFDCDTEERLQEVFSALIVLFKEDA